MGKVHGRFRVIPLKGERGGNLRVGDIEKIVCLYEAGYTVAYIMLSCGCSRYTVHRIRNKHGLKKRKPGSGNWERTGEQQCLNGFKRF